MYVLCAVKHKHTLCVWTYLDELNENERTYVQTVYGARVFCIDTVDHSTFLFKLVGLFVDGNVFSFGLMCIAVVCASHIFSRYHELNGKRAYDRLFSMAALPLHLLC